MLLVLVEVGRSSNDVVENNMIIFLRRIPAKTKKENIESFIRKELNGGFLKKKGELQNIKILILKDQEKESVEFHALVSVEPDPVGQRIIKNLNGKVLLGKPVVVREYMIRSWQNDPRINMHQWNEELDDRRKSSRRRSNLVEVNSLSD